MAVATAPSGANQTGGFRPEAETSESANHVQTMREGRETVSHLEESVEERFGVSVEMVQVVLFMAGSMSGIPVLVVVLSEVFSLQSFNDSTGPFADVITSLETTGGAALGLLVIGLLVVGANRVMGFFGGGGGF